MYNFRIKIELIQFVKSVSNINTVIQGFCQFREIGENIREIKNKTTKSGKDHGISNFTIMFNLNN